MTGLIHLFWYVGAAFLAATVIAGLLMLVVHRERHIDPETEPDFDDGEGGDG